MRNWLIGWNNWHRNDFINRTLKTQALRPTIMKENLMKLKIMAKTPSFLPSVSLRMGKLLSDRMLESKIYKKN